MRTTFGGARLSRFVGSASGALRGLLALAVLLLAACGGGGGPPPAPTVALTSSAMALPLGGSLNLNWQSTNASSCRASGAWSGPQNGNGQLVWTPSAAGSYTFTLSCTGEGGVGSAQTVVEVLAPPTVAVSINPGQVRVGDSATLAWSSSGTASGTASGAWSGSQAGSGNTFISSGTAGSFNYSLQCTGPGGTVSSQATLQVLPALPTVTLAANPGSIVVGDSSTLTWSTTNATSCTATGAWTGAQSTAGSLSVTATSAGSAGFTLTCSGPGGDSATTATVQVAAPPAPIVSISATPASLALGQASTLTWTSTQATACSATGDWSGTRATSGNANVTPAALGTATYGLSCTGAGGTGSATATVLAAPPSPTVAITATPASLVLGQNTTLNWSTSFANACTATGAWSGAQAISGSATVNPAAVGSNLFELQCSGPGGTGSATVLVTVAAPPPPVVTLSLTPSTVTRGQFFTISWTSSNATSCAGGRCLGRQHRFRAEWFLCPLPTQPQGARFTA